jgi:malonate decarboxylase epsilon subunit
MIALLFPGQGAQSPGYLRALPACDAVRETLAEASACCGEDVSTYDTGQAVRRTVPTQLGIVIAGVAFARYAAAEGLRVQLAAGMSVGVFAAAVAAEAICFRDALALVRLRAEWMEQAFPGRTHGMAVIEGLRRTQVESLLTATKLSLANDNAATQFVLAGSATELDELCAKALEMGAFQARRLQIAVPSHGPWLQPVAEKLQEAAAAVEVKAPRFPVFANRDGRRITTAEALREELCGNLAAPVLWRDVMAAMSEVSLFVEAPPGHTLATLVHANLPEAGVVSAAEMRWDSIVRAAQRAE